MGRGSSNSSQGRAGGGVAITPLATSSLISQRETQRAEVDQTLNVLRDIQNQYGLDVNDVQIVTLGGKNQGVMAYYDNQGNLAVNVNYFDTAKMNRAQDACSDSGFHPSRGNKSGLEATVAHELGHRLNHAAAGDDWNKLDSVAGSIVATAAKQSGFGARVAQFRNSISGYAGKNNAECVAEAFSDVYCNGNNAKAQSIAVVNELNRRLGR